MVKTVLSVKHQGLRDWTVQRLSAIFMAIFSLGLIGYIVGHPGLTFAEWHNLFAYTGMKVATIIFLVSILFHAWVGMWTVFTDYVTCAVLRAVIHTIVFLFLSACFIWGVMILWSV